MSKVKINYQHLKEDNYNRSVLNEKIEAAIITLKEQSTIKFKSEEERKQWINDYTNHFKFINKYFDNHMVEQGYRKVMEKIGKGKKVSQYFGDKDDLKTNITIFSAIRIYHEIIDSFVNLVERNSASDLVFNKDYESDEALRSEYLKSVEIVSSLRLIAASRGALRDVNSSLVSFIECCTVKFFVMADSIATQWYNKEENKDSDLKFCELMKNVVNSAEYGLFMDEMQAQLHLLIKLEYSKLSNVLYKKDDSYLLSKLDDEEIQNALIYAENVDHKCCDILFDSKVKELFKSIFELCYLMSELNDKLVLNHHLFNEEEFEKVVEKKEGDEDIIGSKEDLAL